MEKHKNIPQLRFPDFEGEWEKKKLCEVGNFIGGGTPSTQSSTFWKGEIPWISSSDLLEDNIFEIKATRFITSEAVANSATKLVPPNSVLIVSRVGVGKVAVNKVSLCTSQDFTNLIPNSDNFIFLAYLIKQKTNSLLGFNQGTSIKGFVKSDLEALEIHLPSLTEQSRIASFLTAIDKKITELKRKKTLLEQYKKGVMRKLFSQDLRFKDDDGKEFPKWEKKKLGSVGETYNGLTGKTQDDFGTGKPYIQYKQIFDDAKIDITRFDYVKINGKEKQSKVKYGDVFFTTSSETPWEVGFSSVLLDNVEDVYLNSFCFGFRINYFSELNPEFAQYLFRSPIFRKDVIKLSQGSTRYNISKIGLMKIEILLPSEKEQVKIANFLSAIDDKINHTQIQIQQTEHYKKGLLQQMFC
mgnify:CR=1 FL=1